MEDYLKAKYQAYNEFAPCHVQAELLCGESEAKIIVRNVCGIKKLNKYPVLTFNQFVQCVNVGLIA